MPIIQSAKKRVRTNDKRHDQNVQLKEQYRSAIKSFEGQVQQNNLEGAKAALTSAQKQLDKAAQKGAIHKNKAARHKSQLAKQLEQVSA